MSLHSVFKGFLARISCLPAIRSGSSVPCSQCTAESSCSFCWEGRVCRSLGELAVQAGRCPREGSICQRTKAIEFLAGCFSQRVSLVTRVQNKVAVRANGTIVAIGTILQTNIKEVPSDVFMLSYVGSCCMIWKEKPLKSIEDLESERKCRAWISRSGC